MEKIKLSKEQKIKLLQCITEGSFDPEIFPELYNYICPRPITKAEAKEIIRKLNDE